MLHVDADFFKYGVKISGYVGTGPMSHAWVHPVTLQTQSRVGRCSPPTPLGRMENPEIRKQIRKRIRNRNRNRTNEIVIFIWRSLQMICCCFRQLRCSFASGRFYFEVLLSNNKYLISFSLNPCQNSD